jgi:glycosyltransferase involved in cell wall biosynthesis
VKSVVIIPAYNEAATIRALVKDVLELCTDVAVIDDGSSDRTAAEVADLPVTLLCHAANRGKAAALATGFDWAIARGAEIVVTLDGDGQHLARNIPLLLAAAASHPNRIIIGARLLGRESYPRARRFANKFADFWIGWAAGHPVADSQSGQRVYPADLLRQVSALHQKAVGFTFESDVVICAARLGVTTVGVPIAAIHHRGGRRSHFRPLRDISRIVVMVGGHLLRSGMNPIGLWRSQRRAPYIVDVATLARAAPTPSLIEISP